MAYRDYRHFLDVLESKGELKRIKEPVSPYLEVTEIADRVMKAGGPALLFENVEGTPHRYGTPDPDSAVMNRPSIHRARDPKVDGWKKYEMPIAINAMGSKRRMALALGVEDVEEHAQRIEALLKPEARRDPWKRSRNSWRSGANSKTSRQGRPTKLPATK